MNTSGTARPRPIRVRDDDGKLYVVLEIASATSSGESPTQKRYELANRAPVARLSDTEFVVLQTGQMLTCV
jgi:hypothetical protein